MASSGQGVAEVIPAGLPRERDGGLAARDWRLVTVALKAAVAAAAPTAAIAAVVAGWAGILGALVGTLLVLVLFAAGAAMMVWAGRRGPSMMTMVGAVGVAARLMLYAAVLTALDGTDLVHRPSLAVATVVTLIITLAGEFAVLTRTPTLYRLNVPDSAPSARPRGPRRPVDAGFPSTGQVRRDDSVAQLKADRSTNQ